MSLLPFDCEEPVAALRLRDGSAAGELPERPLQDGRAARPAVPCASAFARHPDHPRGGGGDPRGSQRDRRPTGRDRPRSVPGPRRVRVRGSRGLRPRPRRAQGEAPVRGTPGGSAPGRTGRSATLPHRRAADPGDMTKGDRGRVIAAHATPVGSG